MNTKNANNFNAETARKLRERNEQEYINYLQGFANAGNYDARCILGFFFFSQSNIEKATALIETPPVCDVVDLISTDALSAAGLYYWKTGKYEKAFPFLNGFLQSQSSFFNTKTMLQYENEILAYDECLEFCNLTQPLDFDLFTKLAKKQKNKTAQERYKARKYWQKAAQISENTRDRDLRQKKRECLQISADMGCRNALYELGLLLLAEQNTENGLNLLRQAADRNYPPAFLKLTQHYLEKGNLRKAEEWRRAGITALKMASELMALKGTLWVYNDENLTENNTIAQELTNLRADVGHDTLLQVEQNVTDLQQSLTDQTRVLREELLILNDQICDGVSDILIGNHAILETLEKQMYERYQKQQEMLQQMQNYLQQIAQENPDENDPLLQYRQWEELDELMRSRIFPGVWEHFREKSRNSILTSLTLMQRFGALCDTADSKENFNFLCISLITGLEGEMREKLYNNYIQYCNNTIGSFENHRALWPKELVYENDGQRKAVNRIFTFGSFLHGYSTSDTFKAFLRWQNPNLNPDDIQRILFEFTYKLNTLNSMIRIESAHGFVSTEQAMMAFKLIVGFSRVTEDSFDHDSINSSLMSLLGTLLTSTDTVRKPTHVSEKPKNKKRKK